MKKNLLKMTVITMVAVLGAVNIYNSQARTTSMEHLTLEKVEALAGVIVGEGDVGIIPDICLHGGPGSTACSIDVGVDVLGYGLSSGCSVSCDSGYYSCCGLRCICKPK